MYTRVIVPLDGSKRAEQALPYAHLLWEWSRSPVELVQAVPQSPQDLPHFSRAVTPHSVVAGLISRANDYLQQVAAGLKESGLEVSYTVAQGDPAAQIIEEAGKAPNTLIAISTHGWSENAWWHLGSVTLKVLQGAGNPVLVVPSREEQPISDLQLDTVVVPLDGSAVSEQGLSHVVALAKTQDLSVVLVRVTPSPWEYYQYLDHTALHYGDLSSEISNLALEYLRQVGDTLRHQGVPAVDYEVLHGDPADAILNLAGRTPHSLIAMVTHGQGSSGRTRWTVGSVTQRVAGSSPKPVLVIPAGPSNPANGYRPGNAG